MTAPHPRSRVRIGVGAAIVVMLVALACAVLFSAVAPRGEATTVAPTGAASAGPGASAVPGSAGTGIFVHILGAVNEPGLYQLRDGDRAVDAVAAAGGFTDKADPAALNLARFVSDGEQIIVPKLGEVATAAPGSTAGGAGSAGQAGAPGGKVNLNTADEATLETLPRIGPAMAQRILDWREQNGRFTAIEDLMSVTGVGEKTFEGLKDLVTI